MHAQRLLKLFRVPEYETRFDSLTEIAFLSVFLLLVVNCRVDQLQVAKKEVAYEF